MIENLENLENLERQATNMKHINKDLLDVLFEFVSNQIKLGNCKTED